MIDKITNRQIINIVTQYNLYQNKIKRNKIALQWELMNTGETEQTKKLEKQIAIDEDSLGKFLDMEI